MARGKKTRSLATPGDRDEAFFTGPSGGHVATAGADGPGNSYISRHDSVAGRARFDGGGLPSQNPQKKRVAANKEDMPRSEQNKSGLTGLQLFGVNRTDQTPGKAPSDPRITQALTGRRRRG